MPTLSGTFRTPYCTPAGAKRLSWNAAVLPKVVLQDLRSRRPFRDSQLIPTFCSTKRQHNSSRSKRESSYFTRGQYYDDCRCSTLEGASCRCLMRPAWLCDARARHCAQSMPLQLERYALIFYPFVHNSPSRRVGLESLSSATLAPRRLA